MFTRTQPFHHDHLQKTFEILESRDNIYVYYEEAKRDISNFKIVYVAPRRDMEDWTRYVEMCQGDPDLTWLESLNTQISSIEREDMHVALQHHDDMFVQKHKLTHVIAILDFR